LTNNLILGAGISGLSASYHLGHDNCLVIEGKQIPFGHIASEYRGGYTWDQGPHVSFTKDSYVKSLFSDSVDAKYEEYEVIVRNYFEGHWIDHPAQSFLYQIPQELRKICLESFLEQRSRVILETVNPSNYLEWLENAYGQVFARHFPVEYTKKYWTCDPSELSIDWVGGRMYYPSISDVVNGASGKLLKKHHYINKVRYPTRGGYQSFAKKLLTGANITYSTRIIGIDLAQKKVFAENGDSYDYLRLINTLPLPVFIALCKGVPKKIREAAASLSCTQMLTVNLTAQHPPMRDENWIYVYDKDKLSTRINRTESLSINNAPFNSTGIQVEVYSSKYKTQMLTNEEIGAVVQSEMIEMGLLDPKLCRNRTIIQRHEKFHAWANIIFDHNTKPALDVIWTWLEGFGLLREDGDLHPLTNWDDKKLLDYSQSGLVMAGRYGQWKYYWSDDCILRGREIGKSESLIWASGKNDF
jgi:protoporphyrinogen oxidase